MVILNLYDLSEQAGAAEFLQLQLASGGTLARRTAEVIHSRGGGLFAALPEGIDLGCLPAYQESGDIRWRGRGFVTLASVIKRFLARDRGRVLLQDTEASLDDPWLRDYKYREHIVPYDRELYWKIADRNLDEGDIEGLISSASFYPFAAFFYRSIRADKATALDEGDLDEIVGTLVGVAVDAFDSESFLLWWSDRASLPMEVHG